MGLMGMGFELSAHLGGPRGKRRATHAVTVHCIGQSFFVAHLVLALNRPYEHGQRKVP
jgi:hypothetical protein